MTSREKFLYHQIHPAKLAVDISTSIVSTYLLWLGDVSLFLAIFLLPSIVATVLVMRFCDLEALKRSGFGRYVARHMTHAIEAIRFGGQILMWISAWERQPWGIALGVLVIIGAWMQGLLRAR